MKEAELIRKKDDSLPELFVKLGDDLSEFVETKIELLKVEVREDVTAYLRSSVLIASGVVIALVGFALLNAALAFGIAVLLGNTSLSEPARYAIGFLIASILYLGAGAVIIVLNKNKIAERDPLPERSIRELKKDKQRFEKEL